MSNRNGNREMKMNWHRGQKAVVCSQKPVVSRGRLLSSVFRLLAAMLAVLLFALAPLTAVMAADYLILEPGFETVSNWSYTEGDADYNGAQSTAWKTEGSNSYLISAPGGSTIGGKSTQIAQSVDFTNIRTLYFDCRLDAAVINDYEARVLVGATQVWSQAMPTSPTEYTQQTVDVSGYSGTQDLIFQVMHLAANKNGMNAYFDNIKLFESFQEVAHTNRWGYTGTEYDSGNQTAYMYGAAFAASSDFHVGYYDDGDYGSGNLGLRVYSHGVSSDGSGNLSSQYALNSDGNAIAGTWHAVVFLHPDSPPGYYSDTDGAAGYVCEDDFEVAVTAIPEFSTVMAGVAVAGTCFVIYWWMRRRRVYRVY